MYDAGVSFYEAGRYEAAIEAFQEAYELSQRHALLLNIASAYERLGDLPSTIEVLERYLPYVEPDKKIALTKRLESLKERQREQEAKAKADLAKAKSPVTTVQNVKPDPERNDTGSPQVEPPSEPKESEGAGVLAWTTLIGGGLLIGGGTTLVLLGESQHKELQRKLDNSELNPRNADDLEVINSENDAGHNKKLAGYVLLGLGGAAAITGIVLFATSSSDETGTTKSEVSVGVIPGLGGGVLTIQGEF